MADEAILRAKVRAEVHAILTPEQQQQLQARPQPSGRRGRGSEATPSDRRSRTGSRIAIAIGDSTY